MRNARGQTALILILLAAAALIFLAITLNWGRIAQTKSLLTIAADEAGTTLASSTASYGEMEKQTYLGNTNKKTSLTGVLLSVIVLIVAIVLIMCPWTAPIGGILLGFAIAGMVMTFVSIVLQLVWINPMISAMWNKLQQNQPAQQQFYEQGVSTALQGAVTDQVNITDYFDWNANGAFGKNSTDIVNRFAVYYTDRLKMLNQPAIPQVTFFYNQLGELINGETCGQNQSDNYTNAVPINPSCVAAGVDAFSDPPCTPTSGCTTPGINCILDPSNPVCQEKVPNGFQLNDACTDFNTASPNYNPYCDPCCQPLSVPNSLYCTPSTSGGGGPSSTCTGTLGNGSACNCNPLVPQYISLRPSNCDQSPVPPQCLTNNPYNALPGGPYGLIYDPAFQEYSNNLSFLDLFGRDQQTLPAQPPPGQTAVAMSPDVMTTALEFPNGVYPFFWLMNEYSPEVDKINPTATALTPDQYHWCVAGSTMIGGTVPLITAPAGFPDLAQLKLSYTCSGQDCCDNFINTAINSNGSVNSDSVSVTIVNAPGVNLSVSGGTPPPNPYWVEVGSPAAIVATASVSPPDTLVSGVIYSGTPPSGVVVVSENVNPPVSSGTWTFNVTFGTAGQSTYYGEATDANGVTSPPSAVITVNVIEPPTVSMSTVPAPPFAIGTPESITATATLDPQDAIQTVVIYNGATPLGTCASSPCSATWTPAAGAYSLYASVTDTHGFSASTTPLTGTL
jgi:hypothetical protein